MVEVLGRLYVRGRSHVQISPAACARTLREKCRDLRRGQAGDARWGPPLLNKVFAIFFGVLLFTYCRVFYFAIGQNSTRQKFYRVPKKSPWQTWLCRPAFVVSTSPCAAHSKTFAVCIRVFAVCLRHTVNKSIPMVHDRIRIQGVD